MEEQETAKTEVQEEKLPTYQDGIRARVKKIFIETLTCEGSILSNEVVARLLDVSYRTVLRWKSADPAFMPKLKEAGGITRFCADVKRVRKEMLELAIAWPGIFGPMDRNTLMILFRPEFVRIFRCPDTTIREKAEEACLHYLIGYAKEIQKREEAEAKASETKPEGRE